MTVTDTRALLDAYRTRLRAASAALPVDLRDDLLDDVEAHLADIQATSPSPAAATEALERLGTPEKVAAAAAEEAAPDVTPARAAGGIEPPSPRHRWWRLTDALAVILLLIGAFFPPVLGWVVGVVLLWTSTTWTSREKALGTLVVPGGLAAPVALGLMGGQTCSQETVVGPEGVTTVGPEICQGFAFPPAVGITLLVVLTVAPLIVVAVLMQRSAARAAAGATDRSWSQP